MKKNHGNEQPSSWDRIPPNQRVTTTFPVLHYGDVPQIDLNSWELRVFGLVDEEKTWSWEEFLQFPRSTVQNDIHCVTGWTRLDNEWEGVLVRDLMKHVTVKSEARYVMLHAEQGWTTNLPLQDFLRDSSLLAFKHNGVDLTPEHGWPLRAVIPHLYFWKSAKWLRGIEFMAEDKEGFWERNGYHSYGDPWREQRFSWD